MVTEVKGPGASVVSIEGRTGVSPVRTTTGGEVNRAEGTRPEVRITGDAAALAALEGAVADAPVVDAKRVEAVQKALADGSYQVDPRRTAEQFLRLENLIAAATTRPPGSRDE
jgi:flagellar biosynthesis anti-sigma factor FlgM